MSIVNSYLEKRSSQEMSNTFKYPSVGKTTPAEFYSIQGDMIDYIYTLPKTNFHSNPYTPQVLSSVPWVIRWQRAFSVCSA